MWSAAILAGGSASRLGGLDKTRLLVEGRRIIDRQIEAIRPVADEILVVGREACEAPAGVRVVADQDTGRGPLGGLQTALRAAAGDPMVVVACDMPFLTTPFLRHLLAAVEGADAAVPETDRGYHPLCAAYARACLAPVERRLAQGRLRMTELLDDLHVRTIDVVSIGAFGDHRQLLANINTPADCREFEARYGHGPSS